MKHLNVRLVIALITVCGILVGGVAYAKKDKTTEYAVTITNITRGQIISPPIVISHNKDFQLFSLGGSATDELAALAEGGDTGPLSAVLGELDSVYDRNDQNDQSQSTEGGVIIPGHSVTVRIETKKGYELLSMAGMLVSSNDAFFAIRGMKARSKGDMTAQARAYDAGSELNSELCEYVPGPTTTDPCPTPEVGHDPSTPEGYVYIHSGIHGMGDLEPADFDWHNPVATIMVEKVK